MRLQCHPASPCECISTISVTVQQHESRLTLNYLLTGGVDQIRLPAFTEPHRRDELWRHTCAELFVREVGQSGYGEFNFSPSGEWAAYRFDDYRQGMRPAECEPPMIEVVKQSDELRVTVHCVLPEFLMRLRQRQAGLAMVIEDVQRRHSYWALGHPAVRPDFHHQDGFLLEL